MKRYELFESTPATLFEDAHLLGNGALGASVYGGVPYEQILINHDTLWSGQERVKLNPGTRAHFEEARQLVLDGRIKQANNLINDKMLGYWGESYIPLGYLHIDMGHSCDIRSMPQRRMLLNEFPYANYRRTLILDDAVARIEYDQFQKHFTREVFVSHPDDVVAVKLTVTGGVMDFAVSLDSEIRYEQRIMKDGCELTGRAPDRVEPYEPHFDPMVAYMPDAESDALRMAAVAKIVDTDGEIVPDDFRVYVRGASYAVILMAAGTNYAGFQQPRDRDAHKVADAAAKRVDAAAKKGYDALRKAHLDDYHALYNRVDIDLGESISDALPTSERMARQSQIGDPTLYALVAQYVRYLLIAGSRPGTQAANLQGIWNPKLLPSWASNYTTNINVQMNYWAAEVMGLPECHLPMTDLVREVSVTGREAAEGMYGRKGWVAHHNVDLWRMATVAGEDASWAWWPFGGFWMAEHLWEHYAFTRDEAYLREIYPVLLGAAEFLCEYVVKDKSGHYVTAPSTSPENKFFIDCSTIKDVLGSVNAGNRFSANRGDVSAICRAATMDLALVREIFRNVESASAILGAENPHRARMDEILAHLQPFCIGKHGQLQEWEEDYEECTPGMSHVSHLYTVYPSAIINPDETPELFEAARVSFSRRMNHGSSQTGWPGAWNICLNARFGSAELCERTNRHMSERLGASLLLRNHLQIDAICGWGAGVAEMLLQSHMGRVDLLPALPSGWREGMVRGFRARGGYEVDFAWENGALTGAAIKASVDGDCRVRYRGYEIALAMKAGERIALDGRLNRV